MALVPLVLLSLACSDDAPVVLAPHGSASLILIELTDTDLVANAYSIVAGEALSPPLRAGTRVLFALQYDAPLAALQLSEGELHVDPSGGALPPADRTFQLRAERLDDGWLGLSDAPPGLAELRFRERRACLRFQSHQRTLPGLPNEGVLLLSEATPDAVLLGTGQRYFEIKQGSERLLTTISTSAPYYEAFLAPDRELWLLSSGGRFAHGDLDRGFVPGPQAPPGNWIDVDGARAGAPFELYALDNTLSVARFTPAEGWQLLRGPSSTSDRARSRIAWAEPGTAIVIGELERGLFEIDADGSERQVPLAIPDADLTNFDAPYSVEGIEGLGVVVGTRKNRLYLRRERVWETLPMPAIMPKAEVIIDLGDRSFASGGAAELVQWIDQYGLCEPVFYNVPDVQAGARIGTGFVVVGLTAEDDFLLTFFTPE